MTNGKSGYWNVWWTLAVLSALVGVMAVLLEYFGIIRDLGLVIGVVSTALTVLFGLTASTRTAVSSLRHEIVPVLERIERVLNERLPRGPNRLHRAVLAESVERVGASKRLRQRQGEAAR